MAKKNILIRSRMKRAQALVEQGKSTEAIRLLDQLCRQDRANADLWFLAGVAHGKFGNSSRAEEALRKAASLRRDHVPTLYNLAIAIRDQERHEEALAIFQRVVQLQPDHGDAHDNIAHCHMACGRLEEAAAAFRNAIERFPRRAELHSNLGSVYQAMGQLSAAVASYRRALELNPQMATAYDSLGSALTGQGRFEEALDCYRESLRRYPRNARAWSNYLLTLNYLPDLSREKVFADHCEWGRRFGGAGAEKSARHARPVRGDRIRLGFVSSDMRRHSVAHFFEPVLESIDREQFEVTCYAAVPREDEVTRRMRALADRWRNITTLTDEKAAETIRKDSIDILVDLNAHTAGNRLGIFVHRPAPIQVSWIGYPNTTGLPAIDYRIVDEITDPPGAEAFHTEKLIRLPGCFLCYRPPEDAPEVAPLPALENGYITFGSFNNLAKINRDVIELWTRVVNAVPGSRLLVKNPSLTDIETRKRYRRMFEEAGLASDRLELMGHTPTSAEHLALYGRVDIALDTFPYNGTTTTCEALWMGVPVITLAGDRHAGRVGMSLLHAIGHPEWIGEDDRSFVSSAVNLASDPDRLGQLRTRLRNDVNRSMLCDKNAFARRLHKVLVEMTEK